MVKSLVRSSTVLSMVLQPLGVAGFQVGGGGGGGGQ